MCRASKRKENNSKRYTKKRKEKQTKIFLYKVVREICNGKRIKYFNINVVCE